MFKLQVYVPAQPERSGLVVQLSDHVGLTYGISRMKNSKGKDLDKFEWMLADEHSCRQVLGQVKEFLQRWGNAEAFAYEVKHVIADRVQVFDGDAGFRAINMG